jgi:hypothetical protein
MREKQKILEEISDDEEMEIEKFNLDEYNEELGIQEDNGEETSFEMQE